MVKEMSTYPLEDCIEEVATAVERVEEDDIEPVIVDCTLRGFHEYRKVWLPKINQTLFVK